MKKGVKVEGVQGRLAGKCLEDWKIRQKTEEERDQG
jgi:hypothetical protein